MLSLSTWAEGLFHPVPDYAFVDAILGTWTLFHIFIAFTILCVSDAFYKKTLLELHYVIVEKFYRVPFCVTTLTLGLTILTLRLGCKAWEINDDGGAAALRAVVAVYTLICSVFLQKQSANLVRLGPEKVLEAEKKVERHNIATWQKPPKWTRHLLAPINLILRPDITGLDNIPTGKPSLYVSNHSRYGLEMGAFVGMVYALKDVFMRGVGDKSHFGQLHGEILRYFGSFNASRENIDTVMETGQDVLVYPGGSHEVLKPSTIPKYQLMWKERLGFVRMAIKHGYPIVPCASIGLEDMIDVAFDIPLDFLRKDLKMPVPAPFLPHRLERIYFWFGEPISTSQYNKDFKNDDFARELRDKVKAAVETGIRELQEKQARDPNRFLSSHIANVAKDCLKAMAEFCRDPFATEASSHSFGSSDESSSQEAVPASKKLH
jgi:1-acyl-sn-glycerol-3-phosphate acyltransferase